MGTNILASASATSGSKLLRYIVPDHADGLVGPDHGEEKLHDIFRSPGHDCYLGLLDFFGCWIWELLGFVELAILK
jgi:hypothetical protein